MSKTDLMEDANYEGYTPRKWPAVPKEYKGAYTDFYIALKSMHLSKRERAHAHFLLRYMAHHAKKAEG